MTDAAKCINALCTRRSKCATAHINSHSRVWHQGGPFCRAFINMPKLVVKQPDDAVNHPTHYTSDPSGIECIQITRHRNFNVGNAIKYLWRAGLKDSNAELQDLKKSAWYINDEIKRLEQKKSSEASK